VIARAVLRAAASASGGSPSQETVTVLPSHLDLTPAETGAQEGNAESHGADAGNPAASFRDRVTEFERRIITEALARHDGNWAAAARSLGMHRSNLHHLASRLGLRERSTRR
jgi:anaerobic nitric oxide reductase transcription regulator